MNSTPPSLRTLPRLLLLLAVLLMAGYWLLAGGGGDSFALAESRFPPPQFTTDYQMPKLTVDQPVLSTQDWLYLGLYAIFLTVATVLSIIKRSRAGLVALAVLSVLLFGFLRGGCICAIGSVQNVALACFDGSYAIPLAVLGLFILPLLVSLFCGRTFCSSVCPLGSLQELVLLKPVKVPMWLDHTLGLLRYIYLGLAVLLAATGSAMIICQYDPFVGFFRLSGPFAMLIFGGGLLLLGMFVGRPYCRYLCPYGGLLSITSSCAGNTVRITPNDCISCRLCEEACPYGAIQEPTVTPSPKDRKQGRRTLAWMLVLMPVLVVLGAGFGRLVAVPLSNLNANVRIAELVRLEQSGMLAETTDEFEAFLQSGDDFDLALLKAKQVQERMTDGGFWLGGLLGLVFGLKLITLSIRRKRTEYSIDRSRCFACGRCFMYCPNERVRLGLIEEPIACEKAGDAVSSSGAVS